tara:strand:+ start:1956 stop:2132 length:177 start_codon:yes stop_codon:yes gene_type:complete
MKVSENGLDATRVVDGLIAKLQRELESLSHAAGKKLEISEGQATPPVVLHSLRATKRG